MMEKKNIKSVGFEFLKILFPNNWPISKNKYFFGEI